MSFANHNLGGLQHIFLYYYISKRYTDNIYYPKFTNEALAFQRMTWRFKDGMQQGWALDAVADVLGTLGYNGQVNSQLVLACIPASTVQANYLRYHDFSQELCRRLNLHDGFEHITILKEKDPNHLSGIYTEATLAFDRNFFAGKDVIIFDDVVTKGRSMLSFARQLREVQAYPIICCSLGYSYYPEKTTINPVNPFTATHVLQPQAMTSVPVSPAPWFDTPSRHDVYETDVTSHFTDIASHINHNWKPTYVTHDSGRPTTGNSTKVNQPTPSAVVQPNPTPVLTKFSKLTFGTFHGKRLLWEVLSYDPATNAALVISKYGITCRAYHQQDKLTSWDECSLRRWLNDVFFDHAFSKAEKDRVITSHVTAEVVAGHELYPGNDTNDKVYILSINEYQRYYTHINQWRCFLLDAPRTKRQCWLRNYGADRGRAAFVGRSGRIHEGGSLVTSARNTIRPVMLIKCA